MSSSSETLTAGVIGVGAMGRHHARIYSELPDVVLAGVHDADQEQAKRIAAEYGTVSLDQQSLLESVDVVSVAVPTTAHYDVVRDCLATDTHVLVEKPFVADTTRGEALAARAREKGLTIQVGHIERFNPATRVLAEIVPDLDIVAIDIERLGPPVERDGEDNVIMDLMIHDIDILLSLIDSDIESIAAAGRGSQHATAQFRFSDCVGSLTASRLTQQKVRKLSVTAESCRVNVDFIDQTIEIHRRSLPEYVEANGDIRYRHESVVERPMVENGEPLKSEITAFLTSVREGSDPIVGPADAIRALDVAERVEANAFEQPREVARSEQ